MDAGLSGYPVGGGCSPLTHYDQSLESTQDTTVFEFGSSWVFGFLGFGYLAFFWGMTTRSEFLAHPASMYVTEDVLSGIIWGGSLQNVPTLLHDMPGQMVRQISVLAFWAAVTCGRVLSLFIVLCVECRNPSSGSSRPCLSRPRRTSGARFAQVPRKHCQASGRQPNSPGTSGSYVQPT